jgi:hypothetical protein
MMSYKALADAVKMMNDGVDSLSKRMDAMKRPQTMNPITVTEEERKKVEANQKWSGSLNRPPNPPHPGSGGLSRRARLNAQLKTHIPAEFRDK